MIVIDASALTTFILREEKWKDIAKHIVRTISVDHVLKEVTNAIWKAHHRGYITIEDAPEAYDGG